MTNLRFCILIVAIVAGIITVDRSIFSALDLKEATLVEAENWSALRFVNSPSDIPVPQKSRQRILYLTNSHGLTGGGTSHHLQRLLNKVFPGEYEVLDHSSGGMFASEFLQRYSATRDQNIDILLVSPSYVTFSDLMRLGRQATTAHAFFDESVFENLGLDFFLRHFDLSLYLNTLAEKILPAYAQRDWLRDQWELPLAQWLRKRQPLPVRFVEVRGQTRWRFPPGFDNNLFQWRLYTLGRKRHLLDMRRLVELAKEDNVTVLASNLPLHWRKEPRGVPVQDIELYRTQIANVFDGIDGYIDQQSTYPVEFSTYDALHPTWHGAHLHAYDYLIRINEQRARPVEPDRLYQLVVSDLETQQNRFLSMMSGDYRSTNLNKFRRFDISEPENAQNLLGRLASMAVGSAREINFLLQLAIRIDYWQRTSFKVSGTDPWSNLINLHVNAFIARLNHFIAELVALQKKRMAELSPPDPQRGQRLGQQQSRLMGKIPVITFEYQMPNSEKASFIHLSKDLRPLAILVSNETNPGLNRIYIDLLGDGSFIVGQSGTTANFLPPWLREKPIVSFGI